MISFNNLIKFSNILDEEIYSDALHGYILFANLFYEIQPDTLPRNAAKRRKNYFIMRKTKM